MKQRDYSVTFRDFEDCFKDMILNLDDQFSDFKYVFSEFKAVYKMDNFDKFFNWLWHNYNTHMEDEWNRWYENELEYLNDEFHAIISSVYKDTGYLEYSNYFMLHSNNRHVKTDLIYFENLQDFMDYLHSTILDNSIDDFEIRFKENGIKSEIIIMFGNTSFNLEPYYTYVLNTGFINGIIFNYKYSLKELVDCFEMELGAYVKSDITRPELLDILLDELSQKPVITEGFIMNQDYFDSIYDSMIEYLEKEKVN